MTKKKIKAGKSKKQAQDNKYFFGALLTIAGLMVVGVAFALLFGNTSGNQTGAPAATGHGAEIQNEMESVYGDEWRKAGAQRWEYADDKTMIYMDASALSSIPVDEQKKRFNNIGKQYDKLAEKHGKDPKQTYIMFHDAANTNIMIGTYTGSVGAQIQQ